MFSRARTVWQVGGKAARSRMIVSFGTVIGLAAPSGGSTRYFGPGVGFAPSVSSVELPLPFRVRMRNLYVQSQGAPGAGQSFTWTAMVNGAATPLTAAISASGGVAAQDAAHEVQLEAGNRIAFRLQLTTGALSTAQRGAVELEPSW